ncbi:MAG: hypothetical protein V1907_04695 [Candidatus Kerfeldbacteria bacterium]
MPATARSSCEVRRFIAEQKSRSGERLVRLRLWDGRALFGADLTEWWQADGLDVVSVHSEEALNLYVEQLLVSGKPFVGVSMDGDPRMFRWEPDFEAWQQTA